jgi:hypothetical protein
MLGSTRGSQIPWLLEPQVSASVSDARMKFGPSVSKIRLEESMYRDRTLVRHCGKRGRGIVILECP